MNDVVRLENTPDNTGDTGGGVDAWPRTVAAWLLGYRSEHTRRAYLVDANAWTAWCVGVGVQPFDAARVHVDAWVRAMESEGLRAATIARRVASISSLYGYAVDEEVATRNPAARVRRPQPPAQSDTRWLTIAELRAFIAAAADASHRDLTVAVLLGVCGLRAAELRALRIEEIGGWGGYTTILIHGKGGTEVRVPVPHEVADIIETHIGGREHGFLVDGGEYAGWRWDDPSTHLPAVNTTENQMSHQQVTRIVARVAKDAGLHEKGRPVTPHSLRHSAITAADEVGVDAIDLEVLARHADPRTTRRYVRSRHDYGRHASHSIARAVL